MRLKHEYGELYCHKEKEWWYIDSIFVNPTYRNKGVGTWLMKVALARCGRPVVLFATPELGSNLKRLKKFYGRFGFEPIRQRKDDNFPYKYNMICMK